MQYDSALMHLEFTMFLCTLNTVRGFLICLASSHSVARKNASAEVMNCGETITSMSGIIL